MPDTKAYVLGVKCRVRFRCGCEGDYEEFKRHCPDHGESWSKAEWLLDGVPPVNDQSEAERLREIAEHNLRADAGLAVTLPEIPCLIKQISEDRSWLLALVAAKDARIAELERQLEQSQDDAYQTHQSHGRLACGIREALGLKNWPELSGPLSECVPALVATAIASLEGRIAELERENERLKRERHEDKMAKEQP